MIQIPVFAGLITGVALPIVLFSIEATIEGASKKRAAENGAKIWWSLRPQKKVRDFSTGEVIATTEQVDFDPRHGHYMKCGEIVITLASASLVFIPSLHFTSTLPWLGMPMVLFGFTVVYALAFMGLLTYFYEMELQNPDTFTATRSCIVFSLGFSALSCFATSYFVLSILIGSAMSRGMLVSPGH